MVFISFVSDDTLMLVYIYIWAMKEPLTSKIIIFTNDATNIYYYAIRDLHYEVIAFL